MNPGRDVHLLHHVLHRQSEGRVRRQPDDEGLLEFGKNRKVEQLVRKHSRRNRRIQGNRVSRIDT